MLKTILSISGKSGLFRLLSQGKNTLIVESLVDGRRSPVHAKDRVVSLGDITMFTQDEDIALNEVLTKLYAHQQGKAIDLAALKSNEALAELFGQVIENFDRERVYPSDIKKLFTWYNVLVAAGFTSFEEEQEATTTTEE